MVKEESYQKSRIYITRDQNIMLLCIQWNYNHNWKRNCRNRPISRADYFSTQGTTHYLHMHLQKSMQSVTANKQTFPLSFHSVTKDRINRAHNNVCTHLIDVFLCTFHDIQSFDIDPLPHLMCPCNVVYHHKHNRYICIYNLHISIHNHCNSRLSTHLLTRLIHQYNVHVHHKPVLLEYNHLHPHMAIRSH